ncbi:peptidase, partial [Acinetobacter baumannii]|nr:peptidase [Acinetobacter baumannii]
IPMGKRITEDDPYFSQISRQWSDTLRRGLQEMPKPTDDYWR